MNFTNLKNFIDRMADRRTPGNAITVYKDGQLVYQYAAGVADIDSGRVLTGGEYYNIYSCSKVMTVTAAAQLLERGVFLLTDPLHEYIPEYKNMRVRQKDGTLVDAQKPITVGDLFSMTAGLNYNLNSDAIRRAGELTGGKYDTETVARCLASESLSFEPGTHWQYSLCHDVLAALVGILTGMPFRDYVKANILDPLDMGETVYHHTPEIEAKMATQYRFVPDDQSENILDLVEAQKRGAAKDGKFENVGLGVSHILGEEYDSGGAGITTTCGDYAKLAAALAGGGLGVNGERILSARTVELMKTNRLGEEQLRDFNWKQLRGYGYGLGVRTHINPAKSGSIAPLGEFGWGGAAGATVIIDSTLNLGVFYVQHVLNPREEWYQPRLRNVVYGCL
ncbi:MAG: beta-lactamase family protein [Clostridia bacterium]|nr:beta-lactamase family protein [Clostridia bacterium]